MSNLNDIYCFLPSRSQRKALEKHIDHLNKEIADRQERGESTQVMRIAVEALTQMLMLAVALRSAKEAEDKEINANPAPVSSVS